MLEGAVEPRLAVRVELAELAARPSHLQKVYEEAMAQPGGSLLRLYVIHRVAELDEGLVLRLTGLERAKQADL